MNAQTPLNREELVALAKEAPEAMATLVLNMQAVIAELRAEVSQLRQRVAELEEQNRPPSAPHRRREDERKANPKQPGRAAGHAGEYRRVPAQVDEVIEVSLECCPHCCGSVHGRMPVVQWIEDLPPVRAHITKLTTYEAYCERVSARCAAPIPGRRAPREAARERNLAHAHWRWLRNSSMEWD